MPVRLAVARRVHAWSVVTLVAAWITGQTVMHAYKDGFAVVCLGVNLLLIWGGVVVLRRSKEFGRAAILPRIVMAGQWMFLISILAALVLGPAYF